MRIADAVSTSPASAMYSAPRLPPAAYTSVTSRPVTQRTMSKSCTAQSRKMPPETATYAPGGGAGSRVVERTVCSAPSSPLTTALRAATQPASKRRL